MEKAIRVLVANRPRMMRELILATFADQPDIEIVGEVATDEEIPNTVARTMPDLVVVALDEPGRRPRVCDVVLRQHPEVKIIGEIPSLLQQLNPLCIPIRAVLDWGEGVKISDQLFDLGGIQMLDLKPTAAESVSYFVMKRAFDLVFSTVVLIFLLPLLIVIAFAIKLTSAGPILFAQERVGLKGQIFKMYKFRTMRVAPSEESGTRWTIRNDPRCTRVGAFLRHSSLDEIPQFFNVLKGDMSVVGPRPERPFYVHKFASQLEKYNSRHYVKAGITGWAQVNGLRGDTSIAKRIQYDLYYPRHWSIGFDLQIVLLTVFRGIVNKNAY
jgi:exopolysaccharide biosynthesis polyprenyl glycosylphosphotransferase